MRARWARLIAISASLIAVNGVRLPSSKRAEQSEEPELADVAVQDAGVGASPNSQKSRSRSSSSSSARISHTAFSADKVIRSAGSQSVRDEHFVRCSPPQGGDEGGGLDGPGAATRVLTKLLKVYVTEEEIEELLEKEGGALTGIQRKQKREAIMDAAGTDICGLFGDMERMAPTWTASAAAYLTARNQDILVFAVPEGAGKTRDGPKKGFFSEFSAMNISGVEREADLKKPDEAFYILADRVACIIGISTSSNFLKTHNDLQSYSYLEYGEKKMVMGRDFLYRPPYSLTISGWTRAEKRISSTQASASIL